MDQFEVTVGAASNGITYRVELDWTATDEKPACLLGRIEEVAEIPRTIKAGATVQRG